MSRVLQFGALEEVTTITAAMVNEVADEMAEGLNGADATGPVNGVPGRISSGIAGRAETAGEGGANVYPAGRSRRCQRPGRSAAPH